MASLGQTIDPSTIERTAPENRPPLPAGTEVLLHAVKTEVKPTKSGSGISFRDEVIDGPHKGHVVFTFINIANSSAQAQAIGQSELANRCDACGLTSVSDSDEFLYRPFRAMLGVEPPSGKYGPKNTINKYIPKGGASATAPAPAAPPPAAGGAQAPVHQQPATLNAGGAKQRPWD